MLSDKMKELEKEAETLSSDTMDNIEELRAAFDKDANDAADDSQAENDQAVQEENLEESVEVASAEETKADPAVVTSAEPDQPAQKKGLLRFILPRTDASPVEKTRLGTFCRFWSVAFVASLVGFVCMIIYTNILPEKYLYSALAIIGIVSLLVFPLLYFRRISRVKKIVALAASCVLMLGFVYGIINLNDTVDFFSKVTTVGMQTKDYYVVVKAKSDYQELEELQGKKVGTYMKNEVNYARAKGKLQTRVDVDYKMIESLSKLDDGLLDNDYEAIFVSDSQYKTLCEKEKKFEDKSRILFTIRIDVEAKDVSKKVDVTKESFNIYISGLDTSGKITEMSRSDVNMIVTVNPRTHTILLTSIPRDFKIELPSYDNAADKLTHTGIYGVEETIGAVENLIGIDMNYYVKVNYSTLKRLVNAIGGIDVVSDYEFTTSGMKYTYTFKKGKNHLNGKKALAFARERHSFEDGDVQRNRNQVKVMEAIIKKCTSSTTVLTKYSKILKKCKKYIEINMGADQIRDLVKMQLKGGYKWTIKKQNLKGTDSQSTVYSSGDYVLYVMEPNEKQIAKAFDKIVAVMDGSIKE